MSSSLYHIRIILVEPSGALNIGSISRVMKNMGLTQLVIVNPQCDVLGEEATRMAVHAIDLLEAAKIVPDLPTALQGCTRVIATTARDRAIPTALETPRQALPWLVESSEPTALLFGREDSGLTNTELNYATRYIRIPVGSEYSSLNLAQAVGVCAYELQMCASNSEENLSVDASGEMLRQQQSIPVRSDVAPVELLEGYYQQLETLLLDIGYLFPHTAPHRMEKLRRLYNRSQLSPNEVALLRGILSQFRWALDPEKLDIIARSQRVSEKSEESPLSCLPFRVGEPDGREPLTPNSGGTGLESPPELGDLGGFRVFDPTFQTPSQD